MLFKHAHWRPASQINLFPWLLASNYIPDTSDKHWQQISLQDSSGHSTSVSANLVTSLIMSYVCC